MAFSHVNSKDRKYYLNSTTSPLRGGHKVTRYFFSSKKRDDTACDFPDGWEVVENPKNGVPFLRRKK